MSSKIILFCTLIIHAVFSYTQDGVTLNRIDKDGKKQGHWIKKNPEGKIMYEGFFKDDKPTGEFKRYYDNDTLQSVLIFSDNGRIAEASIYHPNGFIASEGRYVSQKKEGKWKFFSSFKNKYLICEEEYSANRKNGLSLKFYSNGKIAEKVMYVNDIRQGEMLRYFPDGTVCLRSNYAEGKLQGKFEAFFDNGKLQFSGYYKDDARHGPWLIYNKDGSIRYKIEYNYGVADNPRIYEDASDYLDSLEQNAGKITNPETTRQLW